MPKLSLYDWQSRASPTIDHDPNLKAVDRALMDYRITPSDKAKEALVSALDAWKNANDPAWKPIDEPLAYAIDELCKEVKAHEAMCFAQNEPKRLVKDIFHKKELVWRTGFIPKLANNKWGVTLNVPSAIHNVPKAVKTLAMHRKPIPDGPTVAEKILNDIIYSVCGETTYEIRNEVMVELGKVIPGFMNELVKSVTPFLGVIMDFASTAWNFKNASQDGDRMHQTVMHSERGLASGTPQEAIQAMIRTIERESNADTFSAFVSLTAFSSRLVALGADAGIASGVLIGSASSLIKLGNIARIIARDVMEKKAANAWMSEEKFDIHTPFEICPVLGAYYVCCVPTSVLVNEIFDIWGKGYSVEQVDKAIKDHVAPLRKEARGLIDKHRFVIPGLQNYPGLLSPNPEKRAADQANRGQ